MAKTSLQSKIAEGILDLVGTKKTFETKESAKIFMHKKMMANKKDYKVPLPYSTMVKKFEFMNMPVFYFENKDCNNTIIYFHGGSFVANPIILQWRMIFNIAKKSKSSFIVPIYPKSPQYTYKDTYSRMTELYKKIINHNDKQNYILVGDSAGGNLALVFAQIIKENNLKTPKDIILLSPCLDLTLSNSEIPPYDKVDPVLSISGLLTTYHAWANNEDLTKPILSPINNDFHGIGKISLFTGTHEILYPDCERLAKKCKEQNIPMNYFVGKDLDHVYPAYPIPEGKKAIDQIAQIILE